MHNKVLIRVIKTQRHYYFKKVKSALSFSFFMVASSYVHTATLTTPGAIQQLDKQQLERYKQEQRLQEEAPVSPEITLPSQDAPETAASDVKNIPLRQFDVDRSELLTTRSINQVLAPYQGRDVSLKELFEAVALLNELYKSKGISTALALLPPQEIKDGVVKIRLIEAKVGAIEISGLQHLQQEFVDGRIHIKPGDMVSVDQLEEDLIRFNSLYESKLRANVRAGAEVGKTDIIIDVQEAQRYKFTTFVDNASRETIGEGRIGAVFSANNLLGINDSFQAYATDTEGSNNYAISYSAPVADNDLRFDISFNYGDMKLVDGPFEVLDITGSSRELAVGLTQPFAVGLNRQWAAYGRVAARNSVSEFSGFTQQDQDLVVVSMGVSGEAHYGDYAWSIDNSINVGTRLLGGEETYTYYRANATRIDSLSEGWQLITRGGLQYSPSELLPSGEQFQVGGLYSVRGYSEGLLSGRNGYFGSVELRTALNSLPPGTSSNSYPLFQSLVFLDHGAALPYRPGEGENNDDFLTSVGLGATMDVGSRVTAKVAFAFPLAKSSAEQNQRDPRIHASIVISWL